MLKAPSTFYGTADAHTRRVTLNLIRASTVCPDDLVFIVDALADNGWDWSKLSAADAEAIYGLVNNDVVEKAKAEFAADTATVVDLDRHKADAPDFIDADNDTHCPLCGHKHIRWGFTLRNTVKAETRAETGEDLLTGSTCVIQYGLRVDAETTAEAALAALNAAIARLTRKAEREDWQREHPDHVAELAIVALAESYTGKEHTRKIPAVARARLPYPWGVWRNEKHKSFGTWARATVKYHTAHGFLTADRTEQLYGSGGLETARAIVAQVAAGLETSSGYVYWRDWLARHPGLLPEERLLVEGLRDGGYERAVLYSYKRSMVEQAEARHRELPPPPPMLGGAPPSPAASVAAPKRTVDDVSDLPGMV